MNISTNLPYKHGEQHFHLLVGKDGDLHYNVPYDNPSKALNHLYDVVNCFDPGFITVDEQAEITDNILHFCSHDIEDREELARVFVHLGSMGYALEECYGCSQVHYN